MTRCNSRNFGVSAAHLVDPVPLLPSGPGGVRGTSLHEARSSTSWQSSDSNCCKKFNTREREPPNPGDGRRWEFLILDVASIRIGHFVRMATVVSQGLVPSP